MSHSRATSRFEFPQAFAAAVPKVPPAEASTADRVLTCLDCGAEFIFPIASQWQFGDRGWPPPKRCHACRAIARARRIPEENRR